MIKLTEEAIAYHEAGHAVVSMKLGYSCRYVTIVPKGKIQGHASCEDPMKGEHEKKVEHALKLKMAGRIAEGKHTGLAVWSDSCDRVDAVNLANEATDRDGPRTEQLVMRMLGETRDLVDKHWAEIDALAQRLLVEKTVLLAS